MKNLFIFFSQKLVYYIMVGCGLLLCASFASSVVYGKSFLHEGEIICLCTVEVLFFLYVMFYRQFTRYRKEEAFQLLKELEAVTKKENLDFTAFYKLMIKVARMLPEDDLDELIYILDSSVSAAIQRTLSKEIPMIDKAISCAQEEKSGATNFSVAYK